MSNEEKYLNVFMSIFDIDADKAKSLSFQDIPTWDSVGHMVLINALEETFNIMLEPDDIVNINTYANGKKILSNYNIIFDVHEGD